MVMTMKHINMSHELQTKYIFNSSPTPKMPIAIVIPSDKKCEWGRMVRDSGLN